jgi:ATP-dependent Clp protease ATP-binding subunit ClpC
METENRRTTAIEYIQKGIESFNQGDYAQAVNWYEQAVATDATYAEGYYNAGLAYNKLIQTDKANSYFEKAIAQDPFHADALNELGIYYLNTKEYEKAAGYFLKILEKHTGLPYVYLNLGILERRRGNHKEAFEYLSGSLNLKPNYVFALNELGNHYYDKNDYTKAKECYMKAIFNNPHYHYALYNMALISEIESDFLAAKKYYEKTLEADPGYNPAKEGLDKLQEKIKEAEIVFGEKPLQAESSAKVDENSFIKKVGRNLNQMALAGKLPEVIGREKELQTIYEILFKRFKNNPLLLGYAGVGKTAVIEGMARRIVEGRVPEFLKSKEIIELNTGLLVAGTKYRGELEQKIKTIIDEARANPNLIIFIDEIHTIMGAGRAEGDNLDISQMLKPALARGEFCCIGATTQEEYRKYIEKDPALERRFYPLVIDELSPECTKEILCQGLAKANEHYHVQFTQENVTELVDLAVMYMKKRYLPDKAIDVFEKLAARVALRGQTDVTSRDIKEIIGEMTGLVINLDTDNRMQYLVNLEDALKQDIFGQDDALAAVCNILRIAKRRLDLKPQRPDGIFLFTGPTGVGKTYLAQCLARHMFGSEENLIRIDMSEFHEAHSLARLIGAPPGYIGYDQTPFLTARLEEKPTSILLLDEVEKAHPDVIKLFLQVFDAGIITDTRGKRLFFSDTTVIMTSNALVKERPALGFTASVETKMQNQERSEKIIHELTQFFPIEFLNRIDEVVLFNPLTLQDIEIILNKKIITGTCERFKAQGIDLSFEPSLLQAVLEQGYSPALGARNLERTFERLVMAPLVKHLYAITGKSQKLKVLWDGTAVKVSEEC